MFRSFTNFCTRSTWTQSFPPPPTFTEKDVLPGSQVGKVFIVTGGNSGLGRELIKLLYPTGATIYVAARSQERAERAIDEIKAAEPAAATPSRLKYLHLDLNDLTTIKPSAAAFASQETQLDILWNNAGIGGAPAGTTTAQGIEGHMGVNCVAPLLFTEELVPQLRVAAAQRPPGSVRIVWASSLSMETLSPPGGIDFALLGKGATEVPSRDYAMSKCGNWFLAMEGAKRHGPDGIISVAENPGQLDTDVWRYQSSLLMMGVRRTLHDRKLGAYTMLYAGFSQDVTQERNGAYVLPWGRLLDIMDFPRRDITEAINAGQPTKFWEWCTEQWGDYV
ncbi:short-chain dehydrogenase protein [Colletotrichum tofieldiae]|nr:short-chain dehydrogenase protein [Colletotrichum tofieldiae]